MNDKVKELIEKWESSHNEEQQKLEVIKDFVSGDFVRKQEFVLDEKWKMINELKNTI